MDSGVVEPGVKEVAYPYPQIRLSPQIWLVVTVVRVYKYTYLLTKESFCTKRDNDSELGVSACELSAVLFFDSLDWATEGKERKEVYLYSAFIVATTLKALRRGSHSFTCK